MSSGTPSGSDVFPFVYVPGGAINENKKVTFAALKAAIITGNAFGGSILFERVPHVDGGGADLISFGGYFDTKIDNTVSFPAQQIVSPYAATIANAGSVSIGVDYRQQLDCLASLNVAAFDTDDVYICNWRLVTMVQLTGGGNNEINRSLMTDNYSLVGTGGTPIAALKSERSFYAEAKIIIPAGATAIVSHKAVVTKFERYSGAAIPGVTNLFNLRFVNPMADSIPNITIYKS